MARVAGSVGEGQVLRPRIVRQTNSQNLCSFDQTQVSLKAMVDLVEPLFAAAIGDKNALRTVRK